MSEVNNKNDSFSSVIRQLSARQPTVLGASSTNRYQLAYQTSNLLGKMIDYKCDRATELTPLFYGDSEEDREQNKALLSSLDELSLYGQDILSDYTWSEFWREAMKLADVEGNSYVIIGTNKADTTLPLDESEQVEWVSSQTMQYVTSDRTRGIYTVTTTDRDTNIRQSVLDFHPSRIIKLAGKKRLNYQYNQHDISLLAGILNEYDRLESVHCNSNEMISKHSAFVFKKRGLNNLRATVKEETLKDRLIGLMQGISDLGGLFIDTTDEDADFITRNYSGVDSIIQINIDYFIAHTDYPKSFITGINDGAALSSSGNSDEKKLAQLVKEYQFNKYASATLMLLKRLAPQLGYPEITEIDFDSTYPESRIEAADASFREAEASLKAVEAQRSELQFEQDPLGERQFQQQLELQTAKNTEPEENSADNSNTEDT